MMGERRDCSRCGPHACSEKKFLREL